MAETLFGKLVDELMGALHRNVLLETHDGVRREGRLSNWHTRALKLNGKTVDLPIELELNGDPQDTIRLDRIQQLIIKD